MKVRLTVFLAMGLAGCGGGTEDVPGGGEGLDGGVTTTGVEGAAAGSSTAGVVATTGLGTAPTGAPSPSTLGEGSGPSGSGETTSTGSTAGGGPVDSTGVAPEGETGTADGVCANVTEPGTHAEAAAVLVTAAPCGLSSCHGPGLQGEKAGLVLLDAPNLRDLLVDKPSCQAPGLPLVDGRGGDEALANSWLYQKLAGEVSSANEVVAQDGWGESVVCDQSRPDLAPFGMAMPLGTPGLPEEQLAPVRAWICNQAPGPE